MKNTNSMQSQLKILGSFFGKIATAVVSGLPREKVYIKPENRAILKPGEKRFKPDSEKHHHRPMAKPAVETQTLLKEKKKTNTANK